MKKNRSLTKHLPDSPPTFDVSVRNSNGTDISREIPILHQFSTVSLPPSTSKRDLSSPQNDCPLPSWPVFEGSVCLRQTSPQALLATCRHQTDLFDFKNVHSHCADNEICVDGIRAKAGFATQEVYMAYCVNTENFIRIIQDHTTTWSAAESVEVNTNSNDYAIEAVMTGLDHKTSVFAEFLNIQSQVYDTSKNYATWRSLPNGNDNCHNCASVQIQPIPAGTQRIRVDVVLNTVKAAGLLYLATIASS